MKKDWFSQRLELINKEQKLNEEFNLWKLQQITKRMKEVTKKLDELETERV
ncbi:hypothetical protein ACWA16_13500 [Bacillus subtilis]|uniref:hypothetical protein n=1 Tax=Bacillus TaxID=1386 RepID=UPI001378BD3E|nr:hypothetical protein [Bacillus subtilis]KAF1342945.1 hypothetical protein ABP1_3718 [Bacillus subtilis]MEC1490565.1 hypothetical protein [Bacillus subtilis]NRF02345.1 hypothetical protein [Bacillus subtilis]NRG36019.1 hypothetical protein [Bacillus subtilis]